VDQEPHIDLDFIYERRALLKVSLDRLRDFMGNGLAALINDDPATARRYLHTVCGAVLVFAHDVFYDFLVGELFDRLRARTTDTDELAEKERSARHDPRRLGEAYSNSGIGLFDLPQADVVEQARLHRNALVHNRGCFTQEYLEGPVPQAPPITGAGLGLETDPASIVNIQPIPVDSYYVETVLAAMQGFAEAVVAELDSI
jgi:hypothetical protein